jgi:ATP-dependent RNA helicase DeaD
VRAAVAALAPDAQVLAVEVRQSHSFVEVSPEALEATVAALNGKAFEGTALTAEKARRKRR